MHTTLTRKDIGIISLYCLIVFGVCLVSGRALTMHEGVLPQSTAQMFQDHDWLVPKNGDSPWLENPPLPQWISVAFASVIGRCDEVWITRLGSVFAAWVTVLSVAWMGSVFFGRTVGLLSGLVMATICEFTRYSWLAEDEIYLVAMITGATALFIRCEFVRPHPPVLPDNLAEATRLFIWRFFQGRDFSTLAFFIVLGLTNMVKGLVFGTAITLAPIAGYLLLKRDISRISHYCWLWGWAAFFLVAGAYPYLLMQRYPDVVDLWAFDLGGRVDGSYAANTQPIWYYPVNILWMLAPWTIVMPMSLMKTWKQAWNQSSSPERFLWCWILCVPLLLTIPSGKHHHYLLNGLAPWGILGAIGLQAAWKELQSWPAWLKHPAWSVLTIAAPLLIGGYFLTNQLSINPLFKYFIVCIVLVTSMCLGYVMLWTTPRIGGLTLFSLLAVVFCVGHVISGYTIDRHREDAWFCQQIRRDIVPDGQIWVDEGGRAHAAMMNMFYLGENTYGLHNMSFLQDQRVHSEVFYVLAPYKQRIAMEQFGEVDLIAQSKHSAYEQSIDDRLTLFKMSLHDGVEQVSSAKLRINPLQGMQRAAGPELTILK
jgi:4-amino-4-deoxy-L-arabinose transferase-like glycosyltransferase